MALPPPTCAEMRTFYPVLGAMELSAELGYTTNRVRPATRHENLRILLIPDTCVVGFDLLFRGELRKISGAYHAPVTRHADDHVMGARILYPLESSARIART